MTSPTTIPSLSPEKLAQIGKLTTWQALLAALFVFLLLPSLTSPPSILTLSAILCSVLVYRSWLGRITARKLAADGDSGLSTRRAYWSSVWTLAWRSFSVCVLLMSLTLFVAPDPERAGAGVGVLLLAWLASLLLSLDVPVWILRGFNPTAVSAGIGGILGLVLSIAPIVGPALAAWAVVAGIAARREFASNASAGRGRKLAFIGLILGAVALTVNLALVAYVVILGQFRTHQTPPMPATRTEEMQQRAQAFAERTGDGRVAEMMQENAETFRQLEQQSQEMVSAGDGIQPEVIFDPAKATPEAVAAEVEALRTLQSVALKYKDRVIEFREKIAGETAKKLSGQPELLRQSLETSQAGMALAAEWSDTAVAFSDAGRRLLQSYQETGSVDPKLLQAVGRRGVEYADAGEKVIQRRDSNLEKMEQALPR
jgi:hypothetical protein